MLKKILFAIQLSMILYLLSVALTNTGCSGEEKEVAVFLQDDLIPVIAAIPETSEIVIEEETEEPTEIIEITTETTTVSVYIPSGETVITGVGVEIEDETEIEEYDGPERFAELYRIIAKYGGGVSVFYKDLTDGEEFFYNPHKNYFVASLVKAPYAVYAYREILAGNGDLDQIYTYRESDLREGTGIIKNMDFGTELTLAELIEYSIRWSDNAAMDIIRRIFPVAGYREYAESIGVPHIHDIRSSAVNGVICAECAAVYIEGIYNFIEEGNIYSEALKEHMLNTINPMILARYPIVRKYGWAADSFHDMGIVYNEQRPYLIVILCDNGDGDFPMFREISVAIQRYNDSKPFEIEIIEPEEIS